MSLGVPHRRSVRGLLLAVLALVSQLALGAMVLPDDAAASEAATLEAMSVMCASGAAPHRAPVHHRHRDGGLCPLSVALALPAVVLAAAPVLAPPAAGTVLRLASSRAARGSPSRLCTPGLPRGPPSLA